MFNYSHPFWRSTVFTFVIHGTLAFIVLTVIAMFFYPGGSMTNPNTVGYSFFENFFSELGFWVTKSGASNPVAASLFFIALTLAGSGLAMFFLAFPQFFGQNRILKTLSIIGSVLGVLSGLCFVGVAFTPADIFLDAHYQFVIWAFRFFPAAVLFYIVAIFRHPTYARKYGWALVGFFVLLVAYLLLLEFGPSVEESYQGQVIQAVGQKIIVYASIGSITFQAWGARNFSA
jgi:hypothetical protein